MSQLAELLPSHVEPSLFSYLRLHILWFTLSWPIPSSQMDAAHKPELMFYMRKARDRKHIDKLPKMTSITTDGQGHCNISTVSVHRLSYTQSTVCPSYY